MRTHRPLFDDEQLAWLEEMLRPRCCHTTGTHDPLHYEEGRYVCADQARERYAALRAELGLGKAGPQDAVPEDGCHWCEREASRR